MVGQEVSEEAVGTGCVYEYAHGKGCLDACLK